jgi:hypothetical protein
MRQSAAELALLSLLGLCACGGEGASGTSDPADPCAAYMSEASNGEVEFVVTNSRPDAIYVSQGVCDRRFSIAAPGASTDRADLTAVSFTCAEAQVINAFPLDCLDTSVTSIPPGGMTTLRWKGLLYESVPMPDSCYKNAVPPLPSSCNKGIAVEPGTLEVTVKLYAGADCQVGCQDGTGPFDVKASFSYPDPKSVAVDVTP